MDPIVLSSLEARVLGVLVEKQHTVPDSYPLTLLALTAGCNQKSSREPVMNAGETEVQAALDNLKTQSFVVESSGGRVMRYAHNVERVLSVPSQSAALIAALMLRGPQTVGELRINADRMHRFADTSAVEGFLQELVSRPAGALALELPRQPGAREARWTHLLSGAPSIETPAPATPRTGAEIPHAPSEFAALKATVERLEAEVAELRQAVARLSQRFTPNDEAPDDHDDTVAQALAVPNQKQTG